MLLCFSFSLSVLSLFALPADDECVADDGRRVGLCLNTYECRMQGGVSRGSCAFGFGVCCICEYSTIFYRVDHFLKALKL